MATSDFSQIVELQEFRRLYEEQEEKIKIRLQQKEEEIGGLKNRLSEWGQTSESQNSKIQQLMEDRDRMKADYERLKAESKDKIEKLMERVRVLNQRLMGEPEPNSGSGKKSGIFG